MKMFYGDYIQCEVADNHVVFFGGCKNGVLWVEVNGVHFGIFLHGDIVKRFRLLVLM